jgi:geranyl-CoA carboxylase beta subunit
MSLNFQNLIQIWALNADIASLHNRRLRPLLELFMPQIESTINVNTTTFSENKAHMFALLNRVLEVKSRASAKSSLAQPRFEKRGQLLPRMRIGLLLDAGRPFLEICPLSGLGMDTTDLNKSVPGSGVIAGIGFIEGVRCMISANDSGIDAGALQPMGLDKILRVQEIALENKLPFIQLVESAGANLMAYRVQDFIHGGTTFKNLAKMSAAGLPVITITHGSSTAGGAYQTGLSDYIIMVRGQSRAFLAGPPLLKAATGEIATEEELGGAHMHTSVSGLGDYLAEDDRDAIAIARHIVAHLDWNKEPQEATRDFPKPLFDSEELMGVMPAQSKLPVDMREVIARIADGSDFLEFSENYGSATVCGHFKIEGWPVGVITNNGPIDPAGANKATHFIQACCQSKTPIIYLNNTTGFLVGKAVEEAGIIKHGSKMIQAVTNATVPQITLYCGASFGAGNYGMCGRGFGPRFCFSWPNAKTAVMGAAQAAQTMAIVSAGAMMRKTGAIDEEKLTLMKANIVEKFESQMSVFTTSALLLDDGVIDPRDTRVVLAEVLKICREEIARQPQPMQFSVARP